jgi:hypothetical protein
MYGGMTRNVKGPGGGKQTKSNNNYIREGIKNRLNSGAPCNHSGSLSPMFSLSIKLSKSSTQNL